MRLPVTAWSQQKSRGQVRGARGAPSPQHSRAAVMAAAETAIAANGRGLWDRWRARANVDQTLSNPGLTAKEEG